MYTYFFKSTLCIIAQKKARISKRAQSLRWSTCQTSCKAITKKTPIKIKKKKKNKNKESAEFCMRNFFTDLAN